MRAVLLGASGMLGRQLQLQPGPEQKIIAFSRAQLDVRDEEALRREIRAARPDYVINASGYTNVDGAESHADEAFDVNANAVGVLATLCLEAGCTLVHFSTDYVFDGTKDGFYGEDDAPNPLNVYGASKLEGEMRIRRSGARHLILRTQWLY